MGFNSGFKGLNRPAPLLKYLEERIVIRDNLSAVVTVYFVHTFI